jgi:hypothetical protein
VATGHTERHIIDTTQCSMPHLAAAGTNVCPGLITCGRWVRMGVTVSGSYENMTVNGVQGMGSVQSVSLIIYVCSAGDSRRSWLSVED